MGLCCSHVSLTSVRLRPEERVTRGRNSFLPKPGLPGMECGTCLRNSRRRKSASRFLRFPVAASLLAWQTEPGGRGLWGGSASSLPFPSLPLLPFPLFPTLPWQSLRTMERSLSVGSSLFTEKPLGWLLLMVMASITRTAGPCFSPQSKRSADSIQSGFPNLLRYTQQRSGSTIRPHGSGRRNEAQEPLEVSVQHGL